MKPITRDALTGVTAIASILALIAMLVVFGELNRLGKSFYQFTINMPAARGLTGTSPVTLNGVRVGELVGLANADDPGEGVVLTVEVQDTIEIPSDFEVLIERGLIAGSSVELAVAAGSSAPPVAGGDVFEREARASGAIADAVAKLDAPIGQLSSTIDRIEDLVNTYDELGQNLNESVDEVMGPQGIRASIEGRLSEASELMDELRAAVSDVRSLGGSVGGRVDQIGGVLARVDEAVVTIGQAAEEFRVLTAAVNAGEGTAGQLATNPDLYRNLTAATERLDVVLTEAQLLIEKIKAEGVGIHF